MNTFLDISIEVRVCIVVCFPLLAPGAVATDVCKDSVCQFHFEVRWESTMTYRQSPGKLAYNVGLFERELRIIPNSFNAPLNGPEPDPLLGTTVDPSDVLSADGVARNVITINGLSPGPSIEVTEGAQVVVTVKNMLYTDATSIHWHGITQHTTPWMDGAAMVSQCPILPGEIFMYRFTASPVGTHWYHSNHQNQRSDGLYGMLVVHPKNKLPSLPEPSYFPMMVTDWLHNDTLSVNIQYPGSMDPDNIHGHGTGELQNRVSRSCFSQDNNLIDTLAYQSGLINGRGRFADNEAPLHCYTVQQGVKYRFRVVNAASEYYYRISIDNHELIIVAVDGNEILGVTVHYAIIYPGESMDFEIETHQTPNLYWVRAQTLHVGYGPNATPDGEIFDIKAILSYYDDCATLDPTTSDYECSNDHPCLVFNCPWEDYGAVYDKQCVNLNQIQGMERDYDVYGLNDEECTELFVNMRVSDGPNLNGRRFLSPKSHMYQDPQDIYDCDNLQCSESTCKCTYIVSVPSDVTVQMVFTNYYSPADGANISASGPLPIYIHGHDFAVLKIGYGLYNQTTGYWTAPNPDIACDSSLCNNPTWANPNHSVDYNLVNPPVKNTVVVPARGYTVVRFKSSNPGYWLIHCHLDKYSSMGMQMILEEAKDQILLPPDGFPSCGTFSWTEEEFEAYQPKTGRFGGKGKRIQRPKFADIASKVIDNLGPRLTNFMKELKSRDPDLKAIASKVKTAKTKLNNPTEDQGSVTTSPVETQENQNKSIEANNTKISKSNGISLGKDIHIPDKVSNIGEVIAKLGESGVNLTNVPIKVENAYDAAHDKVVRTEVFVFFLGALLMLCVVLLVSKCRTGSWYSFIWTPKPSYTEFDNNYPSSTSMETTHLFSSE